jgi:isopentenyldiphosphate isomerase
VIQTTDPQDELFDVLNEDGSPAGYARPRGEVHRDGLWHRSLHIWVYLVANDRTGVLFQRRSKTKDTWPAALDVTVGGHVRAGETISDTVREAAEEIGVALRPADLTKIGVRFASDRSAHWYDREVNDVFATRIELPLTDFRLHPEEVDGLVALDLDAAIALFGNAVPQVAGCEARRAADGRTLEALALDLNLQDFVQMDDDYARLALAAIAQLAAGEEIQPFLVRPQHHQTDAE